MIKPVMRPTVVGTLYAKWITKHAKLCSSACEASLACDRQHEVQKSGASQCGSNKSSKAKQETNGVHDEDHDQRVLSRIANVRSDSTRFSNNL